MKNRKGLKIFGIIILILIVLGVGAFLLLKKKDGTFMLKSAIEKTKTISSATFEMKVSYDVNNENGSFSVKDEISGTLNLENEHVKVVYGKKTSTYDGVEENFYVGESKEDKFNIYTYKNDQLQTKTLNKIDYLSAFDYLVKDVNDYIKIEDDTSFRKLIYMKIFNFEPLFSALFKDFYYADQDKNGYLYIDTYITIGKDGYISGISFSMEKEDEVKIGIEGKDSITLKDFEIKFDKINEIEDFDVQVALEELKSYLSNDITNSTTNNTPVTNDNNPNTSNVTSNVTNN